MVKRWSILQKSMHVNEWRITSVQGEKVDQKDDKNDVMLPEIWFIGVCSLQCAVLVRGDDVIDDVTWGCWWYVTSRYYLHELWIRRITCMSNIKYFWQEICILMKFATKKLEIIKRIVSHKKDQRYYSFITLAIADRFSKFIHLWT